MWTQIVEQTLLLVLIVGRWLLPVGKTMTRDQLSQLLLVYIGTAGKIQLAEDFIACSSILADIIELFEAFKEPGVQRNLTIVHLILTAWSISLMQFTLVVTATKTRKDRSADGKATDRKKRDHCFSCRLFWETELWVSRSMSWQVFLTVARFSFSQALSTTILLQDGPFLCLRLGLIIHYKIISQSNVFFTTKNFLVVLLQLYRVCVIIIEHRKRRKRMRMEETSALTAIATLTQQVPVLPKKASSGRKRRPASTLAVSNGNLAAQSSSAVNLRVDSQTDRTEPNGKSDPLPRRQSSSTIASIPLPPPPLPPPRPAISHSKSLNTVSLTSHKICTEV